MTPLLKAACLITSLALASLAIAYEGGCMSSKPAPAPEDRILPSSKSKAFTAPPQGTWTTQPVLLPSSKSFQVSTPGTTGVPGQINVLPSSSTSTQSGGTK